MLTRLYPHSSPNALRQLNTGLTIGRTVCSSSSYFPHSHSTFRCLFSSSRSITHTSLFRLRLVRLPGFANGRFFASTTDTFLLNGKPDPSKNSSVSPAPSDLASDRLFSNPSNPLITKFDRLQLPNDVRFMYGIRPTSNVVEIFQYVSASLRIGAFDRAERLIRRMVELFPPWTPELLDVHNLYLRYSAEECIRNPSSATLQRMQVWFEKDMRMKGVHPDETSLALMCRAIISSLSGNSRDRALRRYLQIATEKSRILMALLNSGEFTRSEWAVINTLIDQHGGKSAEIDEVDVVKTNEDVPNSVELTPMAQKGVSLSTLKATLSTIQSSALEESKTNARHRQELLETSSMEAGVLQWRDEHEKMLGIGINPVLKSRTLQSTMQSWYSTMFPAVVDECNRAKNTIASGGLESRATSYLPFLTLLSPETMTSLTISTVMHLFACQPSDNGLRVALLAPKIGATMAECAEREFRQEQDRKKRMLMRKKKRAASAPNFSSPQTGPEDDWSNGSDAQGALVRSMEAEWPTSVITLVGATLLSKLIETATVQLPLVTTSDVSSVTEPAFIHERKWINNRARGMIMIHENLRQAMAKEPLKTHLGHHLPMLCEPEPWTSFKNGGYLLHPTKLVRYRSLDDTQRIYSVAATERGDLDLIFAGLNAIGKTAWRINKRVLAVMSEAWNSGEPLGGLPPLDPKLEYPDKPSEDADVITKMKYFYKVKALDNEKSGYHSNRCYNNLQLEVAKAFQDELFYLPHNIDFRGRAYPLPTHLNHMGADNSRGLLIFGEGRKLGARGLFWLKVHMANIYGFDKASLAERVEFTEKNLDNIFDSAEKPLAGSRWWLEAEDPWQCLSVCCELRDAYQLENPEEFVSHVPVHQDGSCNGLQHYAALGGDRIGASHVNLIPRERPSDIYSGVADMVRKSVQKDALAGDPMALILQDKITRKVVKQTVMTNVYGVTFVGARDQVLRQLDAIMPKQGEIPNFSLANYVAKEIFKALSTMFSGANEIQQWLTECAIRVSRSVSWSQAQMIINKYSHTGPTARRRRKLTITAKAIEDYIKTQLQSCVVWTSPLKLPVVQPYRNNKKRLLISPLQSLYMNESSFSDPVSVRKQRQGCPPNFIHSLDATHMMLTALKCHANGLVFAAVHDSFWTHAADVDKMNEILRDEFVRMHSEPITNRLREEFLARYSKSLYLKSVKTNSEIGKKIKAHRKARAKEGGVTGKYYWHLDELADELERQKLLASTNPEERERGRQMVTSSTILESAQEHERECAEVSDSDQSEFDAEPDTVSSSDPESSLLSPTDSSPSSSSLLSHSDALDLDEIVDDVSSADEAAAGAENGGEIGETDVVADGEADAANVAFAGKEKAVKKGKKLPQSTFLIWSPMEFPPLPKRGDFDVSVVRESTYFFC